MQPTSDPDVRMRRLSLDKIEYVNRDGERWRIRGTCSGCGVCDGEHEHAGPPTGRLDIPVRPEGPPSWAGCTLSGEYI